MKHDDGGNKVSARRRGIMKWGKLEGVGERKEIVL